jgi:hypothetical protein
LQNPFLSQVCLDPCMPTLSALLGLQPTLLA